MCGKYTLMVGSLSKEMNALLTSFSDGSAVWAALGKGGDAEIGPGDLAPALVLRRRALRVEPMRWGFPASTGRLVINARAETASERPMFRRLVEAGRCALPAAGYFEWRDCDGRKHLIQPDDAPAMYLAGLCRMEDDGQWRFVVLTRPALGEHARIHDRMPVTLRTGAEARGWLEGVLTLEQIRALCPPLHIQPLGVEQMRMPLDDI